MGVLSMFMLYFSLIDDDSEEQKFEDVYFKYRNLMYYVAYNILKDRQDAEDAVQTAFIRIANNIKQINEKNRHKTKAFVVIVTERIAINMYNKQKRTNHVPYDDVSYNISNEETLEDMVIDNMHYNEVLSRIAKLPIKYSEALTLKYVYELSGKEIAEIVNISHGAVRKRIQRGLDILKVGIKECK